MVEQIGKNYAKFTFDELREATGAFVDESGEVVGVETDSRRIETGNVFVALRGEKFDGHAFLEQVKAQGAVAAFVDERQDVDLPQFVVPDTLRALGDLARFHRARFDFPVVAITGSYGKTSTRALIETAFHEDERPLGLAVLCATKGNFNNEVGLPLTVLNFTFHGDGAVVEMGMRGLGQIEYLAQIAEPTVGVITNIGPQHIELLGSQENIARAKAELLENLPADGLAVLPADSPWIEFLKTKAPCRIVTFGTNEHADYRATNVLVDEAGNVSFSLFVGAESQAEIDSRKYWSNIPNEELAGPDVWIDFEEFTLEISLPMPGAHNAVNAAAAFAVAHQLGVEPYNIKSALENAQLPGARMRVLKLPNGATLIDDCYNAGPDSTRAALQTLLDFPGSGRRVAVLGAMKELGEFSEIEHQKIGSFAGTFVDELFGVGSETRPLLNSALVAAKEVENEMKTIYCEDAQEAANRAKEWIQDGDVVLVKGSRSVGLERVVEALQSGF